MRDRFCTRLREYDGGANAVVGAEEPFAEERDMCIMYNMANGRYRRDLYRLAFCSTCMGISLGFMGVVSA